MKHGRGDQIDSRGERNAPSFPSAIVTVCVPVVHRCSGHDRPSVPSATISFWQPFGELFVNVTNTVCYLPRGGGMIAESFLQKIGTSPAGVWRKLAQWAEYEYTSLEHVRPCRRGNESQVEMHRRPAGPLCLANHVPQIPRQPSTDGIPNVPFGDPQELALRARRLVGGPRHNGASLMISSASPPEPHTRSRCDLGRPGGESPQSGRSGRGRPSEIAREHGGRPRESRVRRAALSMWRRGMTPSAWVADGSDGR